MPASSSTVVTYPDGAFALINRRGRPVWLTSHRLRVPNLGLVVFEAAGDHDIVCLLCHRSTGVDADSRVETQAQGSRACFEISFQSHRRTRTLLREHGVVRQEYIYERPALGRNASQESHAGPRGAALPFPGHSVATGGPFTNAGRDIAPLSQEFLNGQSRQRYWVALSPEYVAAGLGWPGESSHLHYRRMRREQTTTVATGSVLDAFTESCPIQWIGFSCWDTAVIFYRVDVLHLPQVRLLPWIAAAAEQEEEEGTTTALGDGVHGSAQARVRCEHATSPLSSRAQDASLRRQAGPLRSTTCPPIPDQGDAENGTGQKASQHRSSSDLVLFWCAKDAVYAPAWTTGAVPAPANRSPRKSSVELDTLALRNTDESINNRKNSNSSNSSHHETKQHINTNTSDVPGEWVPVWAPRQQLIAVSPVFRALLETSGMRESRSLTSTCPGAGAPPESETVVKQPDPLCGIMLPSVSAGCLRTALQFLERYPGEAKTPYREHWTPEQALALLCFADTFQWDHLECEAARALVHHMRTLSEHHLPWTAAVAETALRLSRSDMLLAAWEAMARSLDHCWDLMQTDMTGSSSSSSGSSSESSCDTSHCCASTADARPSIPSAEQNVSPQRHSPASPDEQEASVPVPPWVPAEVQTGILEGQSRGAACASASSTSTPPEDPNALVEATLQRLDLYCLLGMLSFWNRPEASLVLLQQWLDTRAQAPTCTKVDTPEQLVIMGSPGTAASAVGPAADAAAKRANMLLEWACAFAAAAAVSSLEHHIERHEIDEHCLPSLELIDEDHLFYRPRVCVPPQLDTFVDEHVSLAVACSVLQPSPWSRDPVNMPPDGRNWQHVFVRYLPGTEANGILSFLGTLPQGRVWRNPHRTGMVRITASSLLNLNCELLCDHLGRAAHSFVAPRRTKEPARRSLPVYDDNDDDVDRATLSSGRAARQHSGSITQTGPVTALQESNDNDNDNDTAWVSIDLGALRRVRLTHYALRHDERDGEYLREWILEGRPDDNDHVDFENQKLDKAHAQAGGPTQVACACSAPSTSSQRIRQTNATHGLPWVVLQHQHHDERLTSPHAFAVWSLGAVPNKPSRAWTGVHPHDKRGAAAGASEAAVAVAGAAAGASDAAVAGAAGAAAQAPLLRYIRLRALRNSSGTDRLVLASWEFYGQVWWRSSDVSERLNL